MRIFAVLLIFSMTEWPIIEVISQDAAEDATSTTQLPKNVHVSREVGPRTNYSGESNEIYASSNRLALPSTNQSGTPFKAETFFNDTHLMSNGKLNMSKVQQKLDNGSGHVMPVNDTSATFNVSDGKTGDGDINDNNGQNNGGNTSNTQRTIPVLPHNFTNILAGNHDLHVAHALNRSSDTNISSLNIAKPTQMHSGNTSSNSEPNAESTQVGSVQTNITSPSAASTTSNNAAPNATSTRENTNKVSSTASNNTINNSKPDEASTQMDSKNTSITTNTSAQTGHNNTSESSTTVGTPMSTEPNNTNNTALNTMASTYTMDELENQFGPVIYSAVYFTNGAISPLDSNPKDRLNSTYWKIGSDQLTNVGKSQMYGLGRWLADRYLRLLNGTMYESNTMKMDSAGTDCSFMSAECVLAGLFPPEGKEVWNRAINWQPIPIREIPTDNDEVIAMTMQCRQYDLEVNNANEQSQWKELYQTYRSTFDILSNNTHYKFAENNIFFDLQRVFDYYNDFRIMIDDGLSLPSWASKIYPEPMATLAVQYLKITTYTKVMQKFKAGPFLNEIINNMKEAAAGNSKEKLHLYSGTVMGLSAIMNSLQIFNSLIPPYASALLIELHNKKGQQIVTISYKNGTTQSPYKMMIPNCENCTLNLFINVTQDLIPNNWNDECNIISIANLTYSTPLLIAGLIVILVLIFLFVLLLIKFCKCISKKKARISYNK